MITRPRNFYRSHGTRHLIVVIGRAYTCGLLRRESWNAMKVIFLDIDGVLNCKKTANPRKLPYVVDLRLLARLRRLLGRSGAKVVLTSTWRYDPAGLFSAKRWGNARHAEAAAPG
jgi:hypothetical protein